MVLYNLSGHYYQTKKMHGEAEGASPYTVVEWALLHKGLVPSVQGLLGTPVCHAALKPACLELHAFAPSWLYDSLLPASQVLGGMGVPALQTPDSLGGFLKPQAAQGFALHVVSSRILGSTLLLVSKD